MNLRCNTHYLVTLGGAKAGAQTEVLKHMHINNTPPSLRRTKWAGSSGVLRLIRSVMEDFAALSETFEKLVGNLRSKR